MRKQHHQQQRHESFTSDSRGHHNTTEFARPNIDLIYFNTLIQQMI